MVHNPGFHDSHRASSKETGKDSHDTIARPSSHAFGDGTIASAQSHEDIAILVLGNKGLDKMRHRYAVYTLLCRSGFPSEQEAIVYALNEAGDLSTPQIETVKRGVHAPLVFYVGQSGNVIDRLYDHASGQGGFFTQVFAPYEIVSIEWYDSEVDARKAEKERAEYLDEANEVAFVGGGR